MRTSCMARSSRSSTSAARFRFASIVSRATRALYDRVTSEVKQFPRPPRTPMKPIDLRSDTVTRPTPAMRRVMADAEVGDDLYGEDPTVRRLEERVAERLGLEDALFMPSGTQANQIAIGVHCRQGDEVLAEAHSHIFHYESGGVSGLWGVQPAPLPGERGLFSPEQVAAAVRTDFIYPRSRLLALENTHNRSGGKVWP